MLHAERVSADALSMQQWSFHVSTESYGGSAIRVWLSDYRELARPSTRHKFRIVMGQCYESTRPSGGTTCMSEAECPPVPADVVAEVLAQVRVEFRPHNHQPQAAKAT